jgi:ubiquinone/menaquinone biosynthesis C-methylase UbiE
LDIGTGLGKLLLEIHRLNPQLELFRLDISASMAQLARQNLAGRRARIDHGYISAARYEDDFFDGVTATGSFYLWDRPIQGLAEIHRILMPGRSAYLFETRSDFDEADFQRALKANLAGENIVRKLIAPALLMSQFKTTYPVGKLEGIIKQTNFASSHQTERVTLGGLPVWLRIEMTKTL